LWRGWKLGQHANPDGVAHHDQLTDRDPYSNLHRDGNLHPERNAFRYAHAAAERDRHLAPNLYPDAERHADTIVNANANGVGHRDTDPHHDMD